LKKVIFVVCLILFVNSVYAENFDVIVLEGNISHTEFSALKKFTKIGDNSLKFTATKDRNLPNLDQYDILWIGQGEICEKEYGLNSVSENNIKKFVENGGVVISMGQDSDNNRPCKTGWIPVKMLGVERSGTNSFEIISENIFQNPNKITTAKFDDAWQTWPEFITLATINSGKDMGIGLLSYGNGFYIVTSLQNESAEEATVNTPIMENILNYAVNLIQNGFTEKLDKSQKQARGFIVWMSNRDGDWEVFRMNVDGTEKQQLTHNNVPDKDAKISPNGKMIAWTQGDERRSDVWIMDAYGSNQRKVVSNASMGIWQGNESLVVFRGKNYVETFLYDLNSGNEKKLWPLNNAEIEPREVRGTTPSPDGKMFVGWSPNPRGTWIFSADGKFQKHVHGGCEGHFAPDGSFVYWVMTAGKFGKASLEGEILGELYVVDPKEMEYGHTYFPQLSRDMQYLVFGSCPNNQHDHNSSDYEIFLMKMNSLKPLWNKPLRLTHNPRTDRWPNIFLYQDDTPPTTPEQLEAEIDGQTIKISWKPAIDKESDVIGYRIYRNGNKISQVEKQTDYVDISTDANAKYSYQVSAVNFAGLESELSEKINVKTDDSEPSKPDSPTAVSGDRKIEVSWSANPELDIKNYRVYRADEIDKEYRLLSEITGFSYVDEYLENGKTYYYRITAVDKQDNESSHSNSVSATPNSRVKSGLAVLYTFTKGEGDVVYDLSGVNPAFNLKIQNTNVLKWLKGKGVEFHQSTMIISDGKSEKLLQKLKQNNKITIEVWIKPANLSQSGPARIVSMSLDPGQRNFTLGQIGSDIAYRLRTTETSGNGIPELDTTKQVLNGEIVHIVATYDGETKYLYINGKQHPESQKVNGDFSGWENYPLVIGNEATGDRTWLGKVFLVAIYDRPLSPEEITQNYQAGWTAK